MRRAPVLVTALAVVGGLACALPAAAATPRATVTDSHPSWATPQAKVADSPSASKLTFRVYLRPSDQAGAAATARSVTDPRSASYRNFLTPDQVRQRFAPSAAEVSSMRNWLGSSGFSIGIVAANRAYIEATGTVAQAERAFGAQLADYRVGGTTVRGPDRDLTVPAALAPEVLGVIGVDQALNLVRPDHTTGADTPATTRAATESSPSTVKPGPGFRNAEPCGDYYGQKVDTTDPKFHGKNLPYAPCGYKPAQLRSAYGIDGAVKHGIDGSGQTVAIVDAFASPTIYSDASTYAKRNDPSHPLTQQQFKQIVFPPTPGSEAPGQCDAAGWYGEETLDVEAVHAMAPGAHILFVGGSDCQDSSLDKALNEIVAHHEAGIISNSYGDLGEDVPADEVQAFNSIAIQAALEGIGVYFSSGDSGDEVANVGHPSADFSASSPWVTAVGGTSLGIGKSGKIVTETGWESTKSTLTDGKWVDGGYLYGAGGGTSVLFAEPFYQRGVVPTALAKKNQHGNHLGRVVPDISALADPNTGMLVGQTQTFPDGAYYDQYRIGGTSLACPLTAGMMAVSDQLVHHPHGFINPLLYLRGEHGAALRDVRHVGGGVVRVDYVNGVDDSAGLTTSVRTFDYRKLAIKTRRGYDDVTGLGSPNGWAFLALP
ncbi:MAG: S53 family peptidase [Sciscionella sp.]